MVHIVPISTYDPPSMTATLDEFSTLPWLNIKKDFIDLIEGEDYDVYARFPADDNVPFGVRYVIIHEPQETTALAENEYIHSLKHHNIEGMPWLGNLLVFKTHWGMEVTHIEEKDLSLVKRLITL